MRNSQTMSDCCQASIHMHGASSNRCEVYTNVEALQPGDLDRCACSRVQVSPKGSAARKARHAHLFTNSDERMGRHSQTARLCVETCSPSSDVYEWLLYTEQHEQSNAVAHTYSCSSYKWLLTGMESSQGRSGLLAPA